MKHFLSSKINKDLPYTSLHIRSKAKEYKETGNKDILLIEIPEPNFTRVLTGLKNANVYSDDWTKFDVVLYDVHVRIACTTRRLGEQEIKMYKGENSL